VRTLPPGAWLGLRLAAHGAALWPGAALLHAALDDRLGADPVATLTHRSGELALWLLLGCLAMTPLRKLLGQAWPLRFRRMLGLHAFCYASLHLLVYVVLDLGSYWAQLLEDVFERPVMSVGAAAWLLMLPLAVTSTRAAMRRLGQRWSKLHRLVYPAGALAVLHFWWLTKADWREPALYALLLALLLAARRWRPRLARA
jgi:sulfoxide reductase heme-binding subunit YedZ